MSAGPLLPWIAPSTEMPMKFSAKGDLHGGASGAICFSEPRKSPSDPQSWGEYGMVPTWLQDPHAKGLEPKRMGHGFPNIWPESSTWDCELWNATLIDKESVVYACIRPDGMPFMTAFFPGPIVGPSNMGFYSHTFFYDNYSFTPPTISTPNCPEPQPCSATGTETIDVWYGTDTAALNLTNKDAADLVGSFIFVGPHGGRKFWKRYNVDVSRSYGAWGDCNYDGHYNFCAHDTPPHVGRIGSQSLNGSQCGPATNVGLWYSFPYVGKCKDGEKVGTDGCTWQATLQKIITTDCLKAHNDGAYDKAWDKDMGKAPFPNVQAAVLAAYDACPNTPEVVEELTV